ncbi:MAG: diguanylate cyclase [Nitrospiria bacterium]
MTVSLRGKLVTIFLGTALVLITILGVMTSVVRHLAENVREMQRLSGRITMTDELQLELSRLLQPLNDYLLTEDVRQRDVFDRSVLKISDLLTQLERYEGGNEWSTIARSINNRVLGLATIAVEVLFIERPVGNPHVVALMKDANRRSDEIIGLARQFHDMAEGDMSTQEDLAAATTHDVDRLMIVWLIGTALAFAAFYWALTRWVTKPLLALHRGVLDLNAGRAARIPIRARDEIGEVGQAFNQLVEHLGESREEVQRYTHQLESLYTASRALSKESSRDVLYQTLADLARTLTESQYAALVLFNEGQQIIQVIESGASPLTLVTGQDAQTVLAALPHSRRPLRLGPGDSRLEGLPADPPIRTLLAVPILAEASLRAQLYVFQKTQGAFSETDEDLLVTIAHDAAQSLKVIGLHEETERMATIDGLTGFINRWALEDRLEEEFVKAGRHAREFTLIFIDLDHLKEINDRFGHAAGDAAIQRFCDAIRASVRATEIVGRYGGDEIVVLMPEASLADGLMVAERILRRVSGLPLVIENERIGLTASLGVATYPQHGRDKEALLRAADYALYQAKAQGRGRVHSFSAPPPHEGAVVPTIRR